MKWAPMISQTIKHHHIFSIKTNTLSATLSCIKKVRFIINFLYVLHIYILTTKYLNGIRLL